MVPANAWKQVGPVVASILIIIAVAVARNYSKALAAVTATMPLNVPLSLWILARAEGDGKATMVDYTGSLIIGILGTTAFVVATHLGARAGLRLGANLALGYTAWGVVLGGITLVRYLAKG